MYQPVFIAFLIFSIIVATVSFVVFIVRQIAERRKGDDFKTKAFSPLYGFILGIFIAAVLMYIPIFYVTYDFGDGYTIFRPLLLSLRSALGLFVVNEDFSLITEGLGAYAMPLRVAYSLYAGIIYLLAPVLTLSVVLMLLRSIFSELRFSLKKNKSDLYIFSTLNKWSSTLAEDVKTKDKKGLIVFADTANDTNLKSSEFYGLVRSLKAICLKKDVSEIDLYKKGSDKKIEIYLLGDDESDNISKVINLTEKYKDKGNIHIFLYSNSEESGYVVDSLNKGEEFKYNDTRSSEEQKKERPAFFNKDLWNLIFDINKSCQSNDEILGNRLRNFLNDTCRGNILGDFSITKVDPLYRMCIDILSDELVIRNIFEASKENKTISVMIVGMGSLGRRIFKTAVWLYQIYGYKLEFNIFDVSDKTSKILKHDCPELINVNPSTKDGDACYDIKIFESIDCFTSDFDDKFEENKKRLKRTQLAFVLMGTDAKNIEAAVMLREKFAELLNINDKKAKKMETENKKELPFIYSVLFDEDRADSFINMGAGKVCENRQKGSINSKIDLKGYKNGASYNIDFIGNLDFQYSYDRILKQTEYEKKALAYHLDWIGTKKYLRDKYETNRYFREKAGKVESWYDEDYYDDGGNILPGKIAEDVQRYYLYEYYRISSIAKAIHREKILPVFLGGSLNEYEVQMKHINEVLMVKKKSDKVLPCECKVCKCVRKTEHMRWVAFMRAKGYRYSKNRNDRAKMHSDLIPWDDLDYLEQFKD